MPGKRQPAAQPKPQEAPVILPPVGNFRRASVLACSTASEDACSTASEDACSTEILQSRQYTFTLEAPQAQKVSVSGSFCNWERERHPLRKDHSGHWKTTVPLPPGRHEYRFVVDGHWQDDPLCHERVPNPFGTQNCVVHVLREITQAIREPDEGEE